MASNPEISFLLHDAKDTVGVAVVDIKAGQRISGRALHGKSSPVLKARMDIPLGHKIALLDAKVGDTVVKYGVDIGKVVAGFKTGDHVHVHNIKTKRW